MTASTAAEHAIRGLVRECRTPPLEEIRPTYRRVEVYDGSGRPWPGAVLAWWTDPAGTEVCQLRLAGVRTAHWVAFDPERVVLLVQGGT